MHFRNNTVTKADVALGICRSEAEHRFSGDANTLSGSYASFELPIQNELITTRDWSFYRPQKHFLLFFILNKEI